MEKHQKNMIQKCLNKIMVFGFVAWKQIVSFDTALTSVNEADSPTSIVREQEEKANPKRKDERKNILMQTEIVKIGKITQK